MTETAKVWEVRVGAHAQKIETMPLRVVDKIAKDLDTTWFEVVNAPLRDLAVGEAVVAAVCEATGEPMPDLTPRAIAEMFFLVDE